MLGPLAVDPAAQKLGIGGALMRHAIEAAQKLGHTAIVLLGAINANLVANPRVTFALARERMAPAVLARVNERQTPTGALLLVGGFPAPRSSSVATVS